MGKGTYRPVGTLKLFSYNFKTVKKICTEPAMDVPDIVVAIIISFVNVYVSA